MNEPSTDAAERADDLGHTPDEELVAAESLIEEISIDGMCGVY